jgi:hypothetical protein
MTGSRAERIAEQRHAQIIEQLHRVNIGLESLNAAMDRMTRLQAETNGRLDGVVRQFVEAWQQLRQQEQPRQPRATRRLRSGGDHHS